MEVHEKRKLLEAIDTLVRRPMQANENTLAEAIAYFKLLVEDLTQDQLTIIPIETNKQEEI